MRPLRLEVEGFTAFRGPAIVDFADAELFALVGPTGAGKTSLIDALTFALYGSVPRLDDRRAVAPVISQNLTEARVRLDFALDGEAYTAVRIVRATKAGATTKEARLERGGEVLAGSADEVTAAVTERLGLTFEHFTTCVSLPQGQFARFLHDKPRSRQDLLVRLLDLGLYERVAAAARQRAVLARNRAELLADQVERLAAATPDARAAAALQVEELARLGERLAAERPAIDHLTKQATEAEARAEEIGQQLRRLDALAAPTDIDELASNLAGAEAAREAGASGEDEAVAAVAAAEARLGALPGRAALEARRADHERRRELRDSLERGEAAEAEARERVAAAAGVEDEARQQLAARSADLERARVARRAESLARELVVGEPCLVCRQPVAAAPEAQAPPDLEQAERAVADAETAARGAAEELGRAQTHQARVDEKLSRVRSDLAALDERLARGLDGEGGSDEAGPAGGAPAPAGVLDLDEVVARLEEVFEAERALEGARQHEREARRRRLAADRQHAALVEREREARRAFDSTRDAVALLGPPAAERRDLAADWRDLLGWAAERRPSLVSEADGHRRRAEQVRGEAEAQIAAVVAACRAAGVEVDRPDAWPGEAVAAAHARAEEAVRRLDDQLAEVERFRAEKRDATEHQQVADALAGHLAANRFEKWLLDEAMREMVAGASAILADLSGGAHALSIDDRGGFLVIDHANASQPRPARTLSGGETFLASLALALALADQVAGLAAAGAARLDALFIDEGFGTLDPDALDTVATALDELGARGRMVGVVTHVRELAERLPVRFEVRKVGGAATVERVEA